MFSLLDELLPCLFLPRKLIQKWLLVIYSKKLVFQHPIQDDVGVVIFAIRVSNRKWCPGIVSVICCLRGTGRKFSPSILLCLNFFFVVLKDESPNNSTPSLSGECCSVLGFSTHQNCARSIIWRSGGRLSWHFSL